MKERLSELNKLYHLSFIFAGVPKMRDIEPAFSDEGDDWIRLSPTTWLVWTAKPQATLYHQIKALLDKEDCFMMSDIDAAYCFGVLPQWAWNWMNSKRPGSVIVGKDVANYLPPPKA